MLNAVIVAKSLGFLRHRLPLEAIFWSKRSLSESYGVLCKTGVEWSHAGVSENVIDVMMMLF